MNDWWDNVDMLQWNALWENQLSESKVRVASTWYSGTCFSFAFIYTCSIRSVMGLKIKEGATTSKQSFMHHISNRYTNLGVWFM